LSWGELFHCGYSCFKTSCKLKIFGG
jgi:hypothetical protein